MSSQDVNSNSGPLFDTPSLYLMTVYTKNYNHWLEVLKEHSVLAVHYVPFPEKHIILFELKNRSAWNVRAHYLAIDCPKEGTLHIEYSKLRGFPMAEIYMNESFPAEDADKKLMQALNHYNSSPV